MSNETRLKKERLQREWTQKQLAEILGVSKQEVSRWENGIRFPRKATLNNLETLFGMTHRELFADAPGEPLSP